MVAVPIGFGGSAAAADNELDVQSIAITPDGAAQQATYAVDVRPESANGTDVSYVDVAFDADASANDLALTDVDRTDVRVTDANDDAISVQAVETRDASGDGTADALRLDIDATTFESGQSYAIEIDGVTNPNSGSYDLAVSLRQADADGTPAKTTHEGSRSFDVTATFAASDADRDVSDGTENSAVLVFQGQTVFAANEHVDGDVQLRSADDGFRTAQAADHGGVAVETADLEPGRYYLRSNGTDHSYFEIAEQDLDVTVAADSLENGGSGAITDVGIQSNRGGTFDLRITAAGLSDDTLEAVFTRETTDSVTNDDANGIVLEGVSDGDDVPINVTGVDEGPYDLTASVVDATAEDTTSVSVRERGAADVSFGESTSVEDRGDLATVTVELDGAARGDSGTLVIGDEDEIGYEATVAFSDEDADGTVTIRFNTYVAGNDDLGSPVDASGDDTAELVGDGQTNVTGLLDAGAYELAVGTSDDPQTTADAPDDVATIILEEPTSDDLGLWVASDDTAAAITSDGDVENAVEDGALTQSESVAMGDTVAFEYSAAALEGAKYSTILSNGDVDTTSEAIEAVIAADDGLNVQIEQTADSASRNRDPKVVETFDVERVVAAGDSYYVIVDTDSFETDDGRDVAAGDVYTVTFTLTNDRLLDGGDAEAHAVTQELEIVERTGSFDDSVAVNAAAEQRITGTTTIAPGSELTVYARSADDTEPRFAKSTTTTVDENGSFAATFDFSEQAIGNTFTVHLRDGDFETVEATGQVVETTTTETSTPTAESATDGDETAADEEDDDTPTDDETVSATDDDEAEVSSAETPGFGAIVALVALVAAALLATRRE